MTDPKTVPAMVALRDAAIGTDAAAFNSACAIKLCAPDAVTAAERACKALAKQHGAMARLIPACLAREEAADAEVALDEAVALLDELWPNWRET